MSAGDIIALVGVVFSGVSALAAVGALWVSFRRGSERESHQAATVAVEVAQDPKVTPIPIEPKRGEPA